VDQISEELLESFDGKIKVTVFPILYGPCAKVHFIVEIQIIPNIFQFTSYYSLLST
jgi:hypothetical protein